MAARSAIAHLAARTFFDRACSAARGSSTVFGMLVELRRGRGAAPLDRPTQPRRVALVSAPFGGVDTPSLALGLLTASLRSERHHVDVHYLDLDVVAAFGLETYRFVAEDSGWKLLVGEWLASNPSVSPGAASVAEYLSFLRAEGSDTFRDQLGRVDLSALRRTLDREIARWLRTIDWGSYDVVGFTVMFQQLNASLRIARAIKDAHPRVRVVLGGINLEGPAGKAVAARHPWLDAVFSGYADNTFPRYVRTLPSATGVVIDGAEERVVLDELPVPEYDDYLTKLDALALTRRVRPQIPLETSRGCWWGQKHHCTFCGLNGEQMQFINKSPARVIEEVRTLKRLGRSLFIVDNILAPRVYEELLPRMANEGAKLSLRWSASLKANLTRAQLQRLLDAGIDIINPGIESLSTEVLKLMDKGSTSMQNVWLLRACRELGVDPEWHLLWGIPGEDPSAYRDQAELIGRIAHLPSPLACAEVALPRFSPMHKRPEEFGLGNVRPHRAYARAYGDDETVNDLAYIFEFDGPWKESPSTYARPTLDAARAWKKERSLLLRPRCELVRIGPRGFVLDTRRGEGVGLGWPRLYPLSAQALRLLERLDRPTLPKTLETEWSDHDALHAELARLERRRLVVHRDGRWMRLVVFPSVSNPLRRAFRYVVTRVRRRL